MTERQAWHVGCFVEHLEREVPPDAVDADGVPVWRFWAAMDERDYEVVERPDGLYVVTHPHASIDVPTGIGEEDGSA